VHRLDLLRGKQGEEMKAKLKLWQIIVLAILGIGTLCLGCVAVGAVLQTLGIIVPTETVDEPLVQAYAQQTYASQAGKATQISPATATTLPPTPLPQLQNTEALSQPVSEAVDYQLVRQWEIPNGGYGRVLFIDPKFRNETDLRKLGDQLRDLTQDDRNAFVWVYDDIKAAQMYENAMELNEADGAFYDEHFILTYTRNINTGFHQLVIMVDGLNGEAITIDY
jgi:hypothetical protein